MRNALRFIVGTDSLRRIFVAFWLCSAALNVQPSLGFAQSSQLASAHYAVATKRPDGQREFDAGLTLLYAFNPEEATYHFQEAARIDPHLAMAYWGIALAAGPNVNTGYDLDRAAIGRAAIAQARSLDGSATIEERALIDALAKRYDAVNAAQIFGAQTAYASALGAVSRRFPGDLTVETLYAESLMDLTPLHMWERNGAPTRYTREVIGLLDDVLKHDPNALGANHYLIHTYEYSPTPQAALESARRLSHLALPVGAEHLAHMPAHIFVRVGDFDAAIAASLTAKTMFETYLGREHSDVHNGYFHHDLQVLNYAYMMSGQWPQARDTATEIARQVNDNAAAVETYLRFHRWRELLALPAPQQPGVRWRFAQGMAAAATGNLDDAHTTLNWLDSLHDGDARTSIARALLAASLATAQHRNAEATTELRHAVALQDGIPLKEPPAWFYPLRETLGARLALDHREHDAQRIFEDDLEQHPHNPRSLFGLSEVLARSDPQQASRERAEFRRAWHHSQEKLTLNDL